MPREVMIVTRKSLGEIVIPKAREYARSGNLRDDEITDRWMVYGPQKYFQPDTLSQLQELH
ncbi:hypothetical protein [Rhodohalobacter sp.]|uniref:hypothetical protein n=1 Tax=Rhodohalobacter sp. TaxID=1974210 RepID=UPI002ACD4FB4|nr:hypothetical protein [Rhodohalobacter sp.]MDZ7756017.1 hypothetical protein [Rhodohalobacter sp.]